MMILTPEDELRVVGVGGRMSDKNSILVHWEMPFHRRRCTDHQLHGYHVNVVCGDEVDLYLYLRGTTIANAFFEGEGCTICLGMASLLTQHVFGKTLDEARAITEADVFRLAPDVQIAKSRRGCALVAFQALQRALQNAPAVSSATLSKTGQ
jgi:nitrogen fixation NifU-like protein